MHSLIGLADRFDDMTQDWNPSLAPKPSSLPINKLSVQTMQSLLYISRKVELQNASLARSGK